MDLPESGRDGGAHPPDVDPPIVIRSAPPWRDVREVWSHRPMFGLPVPLEREFTDHPERCRERVEHELEEELYGASKVVRDRERIKRARHKERARDMSTETEDPDQRPESHRKVIEGTGSSSSRDGAGNEPPSRPDESSVSAGQPPREQIDDADMGDPESDRRRPRGSAMEE